MAAREGGKKVVTDLWVDSILDTGVMADADRVSSAVVLASVPLLTLLIHVFLLLVVYYCQICVLNKPRKSLLL